VRKPNPEDIVVWDDREYRVRYLLSAQFVAEPLDYEGSDVFILFNDPDWRLK